MTIDERLERLTVRHEALAQSVEILRDSVHETNATVKAMAEASDKRWAQIDGALGLIIRLLGDHDNRISGLEGPA